MRRLGKTSPKRAVTWLPELSGTWRGPELPAEGADLLHAIYDRITVAGSEIVGVRLTQAAYAHGLALALPEKVELARPTGFKRADAIHVCVPIEGAADGLIAREGA